jgi:hypothetical protein
MKIHLWKKCFIGVHKVKFTIKEWACLDLYKRRNLISFPVFQREIVWSEQKMQLLIDSIFRGIDIPKLYLQKTEKGWDCIDGHQRIRAIVGFFDEEFTYKGTIFSKLTESEKELFETYKLTIAEVTEIDDEDIRLLFMRLQLGVPLNSGEKLNAIKSDLGDFVKSIVQTPFMVNVSIPRRRYAKEQVCAQICNNSIAINKTGDFRSSKYEDLENLYRAYKDFNPRSREAVWIVDILEKLDEIFSDDATELRNRASIVSIYLLVEEMMNNNSLKGKEEILKRFYMVFLKDLQAEARAGIDATNRFLVGYQSRVIQAADSKVSIKERHEMLKEAFAYFLKHKKTIGYT